MAAPALAPSIDAGITASSIQQKILRRLDGCIPTPVFQRIEVILTGTAMPVNCFPGNGICNLALWESVMMRQFGCSDGEIQDAYPHYFGGSEFPTSHFKASSRLLKVGRSRRE